LLARALNEAQAGRVLARDGEQATERDEHHKQA
jgi:hypothetical protein